MSVVETYNTAKWTETELPIKIAVYGTLRKGYGNHTLIEEAKFLKEDTVRGAMYCGGVIPFVHMEDRSDIVVEIYEVSTEKMLRSLDMLEGHNTDTGKGFFYERRKTTTASGVEVETYYALGIPRSMETFVASGDFKDAEFRRPQGKYAWMIGDDTQWL